MDHLSTDLSQLSIANNTVGNGDTMYHGNGDVATGGEYSKQEDENVPQCEQGEKKVCTLCTYYGKMDLGCFLCDPCI